jgi:flagellar basal body L-ring protein FlgH
MKQTLYIMALSAALSIGAFASDFSGKLIDATCNDQQQQTKAASCAATSATTSFAVDMAGKIYKLDATGNSKAATALKDRADRSTDPAKALSTSITAKVMGTEKNGVIVVDSIEVQ